MFLPVTMIRPFVLVLGFATLTTLPPALRAEPRIIHESKSMFGMVIVTEDQGLRTLQFERGGARQTVVKVGDPAHLELPYAPAAFTGLALCREPRRVLVVGLGGGTLPMFLRHYYPEATIDAVDIDPDVVRVAREYFGFKEDARLRGIVADGRAFIEQTREPYDLLFLDAFGSDFVPPTLTTQEFLQAVRRAVRPDGVVVGNIWGRESNRLYDAMVRTYQEVFDDLYLLNVRGAGNVIVLALPRRLDLSRSDLAAQARRVSTAKNFRYDLGERVEYGFSRARDRQPGVRVLKDAELPKP